MIDAATCFHHKDRETGRSCTRCGRAACSDCLHQAAVGSHCFECIRAARPPVREQIRRRNATLGPIVTKVLIALNVGVYLLTTGGGRIQPELVLFGPAVNGGELYRLVTSGFVHFGLFHIGMNMLLLFQLGSALEAALGRTRFLVLYVAALLAGSFGALLLSPTAFTGGASGAVYGLMGATAVGMRQRGIGLAEGGIGGLIAINLFLSFVLPGISLGAHLGGLIGGAIVGAVMLRSASTRASQRELAESIAVGAAVIVAAVAASLAVVS